MHVSTTTAQTPKFRLLLPDYRRRGLLPLLVRESTLLVRESTLVSKITRKHNELSSACKAAAQLRDVRSAFRPAGVHEADRSHEFVAAIVTTPNVLDPAR
jgi:hypothetical protein